jgi:hypothetical protein
VRRAPRLCSKARSLVPFTSVGGLLRIISSTSYFVKLRRRKGVYSVRLNFKWEACHQCGISSKPCVKSGDSHAHRRLPPKTRPIRIVLSAPVALELERQVKTGHRAVPANKQAGFYRRCALFVRLLRDLVCALRRHTGALRAWRLYQDKMRGAVRTAHN